MRYTPSGRPVTTFFVVTTRERSTTDGERKKVQERFNVVTWDSLAEICSQDLANGCLVYIEGMLQSRRWVDKDGVKHNSVEVVASEMLRLNN
jgi:single-strand DNA-binding protein